VELESVLQYLDEYLGVADHPDYPTALNGLQVQGPDRVEHVCVAVDASEETIRAAAAAEADLLLVHHGLFWSGLRRLTGRRFRKVAALVRGEVGLYSVHLPLDAHPDVGNCALLARALGLEASERFGEYEGAPIGWCGSWADGEGARARSELEGRLAEVVDGPVRLLAGGPPRVERVGVVTGGGGSFIEDAARAGLDTLVTGEGSHHTYVDAMELGVNVLYGGHYATETFGVRALADHLAGRFGLRWTFLDFPSGL
jgi:dinuclear metal center YbgI/SA1388 family protein